MSLRVCSLCLHCPQFGRRVALLLWFILHARLLVLLCRLLHVTCDPITISTAVVTSRTSAFSESWSKLSHASSKWVELILKALVLWSYCRTLVSSVASCWAPLTDRIPPDG